MALIAPGAFLWLTFAEQSSFGKPSAPAAMWLGIVFALLLCLATAVSYAELSKLYPGAGSSYFFAEQAFLSKKQAFKWARVYKFMVGWASHLYYWVYPGVMVCVTCIFVSYMAGQLFPNTFSTTIGSPLLMVLFAIVFAFGVSYIAFRGVVGATSVNVAINIIQITALLIFSIMAIAHRVHVKEGDPAWTMDSTNTPTQWVQDATPASPAMVQDPNWPNDPTKQIPGTPTPKTLSDGTTPVWVYNVVDAKGNPITGSDGNPVVVPTDSNGTPLDSHWTVKKDASVPTMVVAGAPATQPTTMPVGTVATAQLNTISYKGGMVAVNGIPTFQYHESAVSVLHWHSMSYVFIQACVAILILVGFESVSSMGEEAKNAKRDIPKAIILSLIIQGGFCYLFEYFAANYFQSSAYTNSTASGSSAPIGDMMQLVGAWCFGSASAGWWFMFWEAITVFLAMIGTTLSCINTGARVTYAMGRDEEVPNHFGLLHGKNATPHRCIWTLATISVVIGIIGVVFCSCGPSATFPATVLTDAQKKSIWFLGAISNPTLAAKIPNSFLVITLVSNFGTFLLYMMSCLVAMVAFHEHHMHNVFKHKIVPMFGLLANLACMIFYLVGPFSVAGMSWKESYIALAVAAIWGGYGVVYFLARSKKLGREVILTKPSIASA
jgi:amino acid transporter